MAISRRHKILIIDEIAYMRLMLEYALTSSGYKVATARNSSEAMQHISTELPDLILLSLRTADVSGGPILMALKDYFRLRLDIAQGAEPPIIVLSALRDPKQNREMQSLGVSMIIPKPINMQELLESVKLTITNRKQVVLQARRKIAIFDTETRSQQFLESILIHETYDIEAADSEAEFLARIKNRKFDLSIIDLASIESDIVGTLESVREMAERMPIVTIATAVDRIPEDKLKEIGIQAHFVKPLNVSAFRSEVDSLLDSQVGLSEEIIQQSDDARSVDEEQTDASSDESEVDV